ncbi:soluble NSF attachment protein receptor [Tribonema minus]|uniref:Soluble NSF attachment protein receptor n=1 Tax=Tribonema minus TaxID=303371 RepID=A0A835YLG5_9STRA|nr:soluble NSF attachment protein receptor [Tribonema minus]
MATRDLTGRFVQLREYRFGAAPKRVAVDDANKLALLEDPGQATNWEANKAPPPPPVWVEKVDNVDADLRKIQMKMRELSALHTKRLMVTFDDASEQSKERDIEFMTQEITQIFRHAERELKKIMTEGGGGRTEAEATVRTNLQKATARKLQNLSMAFRSSQKDYLRRLKLQKEGGQDFDFLAVEEKAAAKAAAAGVNMSSGFNQAQMAVLEETESYVQERDAEIRNIVKSIEELSAIFKELAVMVIDQGTMLDRIDYNMEQVVEHTKEGVVQLQKAEEHQKSAMPLKCIAVLVFLIFVMVIVLILKHTKKF